MILQARIDFTSGRTAVCAATEGRLLTDDRRDLDDVNDRRLIVLGVRRGEGGGRDGVCRYEIRVDGLNSHMTKRIPLVSSSVMTNRYEACACASSSRSETIKTEMG